MKKNNKVAKLEMSLKHKEISYSEEYIRKYKD